MKKNEENMQEWGLKARNEIGMEGRTGLLFSCISLSSLKIFLCVCVLFLIPSCVDSIVATDRGVTPAHVAAQKGSINCLRVLFDAGTQIQVRHQAAATA